ncbi:MAG: DUF87 domain-containing protein [Alphaproteobacteria bacterium]|nr:DUF87 domain-containing protein [Alphaproteobacteria bacterium]
MSANSVDKDRRDGSTASRVLGYVVKCNGARATVAASASMDDDSLANAMSVGRLITIRVGENRVVALVYSMQSPGETWAEHAANVMHFEVELVGEIRGEGEQTQFSAGISDYPTLGAVAHRIRGGDLDAIYSVDGSNPVTIGNLSQNSGIDASISADALLDRHFAIVGTTGVGKSTAVSLLVNRIVNVCPDLRVLILDPHNEFAAAFKSRAHLIDTDTLDLPFWLFRLEEFAEVIFRGRPVVAEEVDILRDLIAEAKRSFKGAPEGGLITRRLDRSSITSDTPVPYRVADLLALIDERIGQLEGREEKPHLRILKARISSVINDPRFRFMFSNNTITDTIVDVISDIFRIPGNGQPITSFQLSGIPSEVVNSVASVLCRMAFEIALWSNGRMRILVLCEEAHRYVPADRELGFFPTRQAIARIAKEGRKYGVSLGVITQRPGELDPTILSQCSTVFAMRLANDHDQEIIRSAISNSSSSTTSFLSAIGNGEAIAFGEAVAIPMRMCFERLPASELPKTASGADTHTHGSPNETGLPDIRHIVRNMRHVDDIPINMPPQAQATAGSLEPRLADLQGWDDIPTEPIGETEGRTRTPSQFAKAHKPESQSLGSVHSESARGPLFKDSLLKKPKS